MWPGKNAGNFYYHYTKNWLVIEKLSFYICINKTKDWALVQNAALVIDIKVLKLG